MWYLYLYQAISADGTGEGDGLAEDLDVVHLFIPVDQGFVHGVLGFQDDVVIEEPDTLEGGLVVDKDSSDLTVVHSVLLADVDGIAVEDPSIDHAVSFAAQNEIAVDVFRHIHIIFYVLL